MPPFSFPTPPWGHTHGNGNGQRPSPDEKCKRQERTIVAMYALSLVVRRLSSLHVVRHRSSSSHTVQSRLLPQIIVVRHGVIGVSYRGS